MSSQHSEAKPWYLRRWLSGLVLFGLLAGVLVLARWLAPETEAIAGIVDTYLPQGLWGYVCYVLSSALLICIAMPRQLLSFAGGYAFGALTGSMLATIGVTLGCMLAFSVARWCGQGYVARKYGDKARKINELLLHAPFSLAVLIRLLPSGNNLLFSIAAGVSVIPALPFWAGSCVGYIPQNLIFALLGSGIRVDPVWRVSVSGVLFVGCCALGWWLYRRYRSVFRSLE